MFALTHRSRCAIAATGAIFATLALILVPLSGRSAIGRAHADTVKPAPTTREPFVAEAPLVLPQIKDPFARRLPATASQPVNPKQRTKPVKRLGHPFVQAIIAGVRPRALIEDGSMRIVAPGDAVDGSTVLHIDPNAVTLRDGRRLGFRVTSQ